MKAQVRSTRKERGFTLLELIVVIVLVALVSTTFLNLGGWNCTTKVRNDFDDLNGFLQTLRAQAISLQIEGVIPMRFISIDVSDAVCQERFAGRVVDPSNTGTDGLEDHKRRLAVHRRNEPEVHSCYPGALRVSGERTPDEIFEDIQAAVDAKLVTVD